MSSRVHCFGGLVTTVVILLDVLGTLAAAAVTSPLAGGATGAEICFKPQCQLSEPVVRLGDLADIVGTDAATRQRLEAMELMPAPPPATRRSLRAKEVVDLLRLHGVTLSGYRLSGANQVVVEVETRRSDLVEAAKPNRFAVRRATTRVRDAIVGYLQTVAAGQEAWQVGVTLDPTQVGRLAEGRGALQVAGGVAPWVGRQIFAIHAVDADGAGPFRVVADVSLPPAAVVAVRSLPPGVRIAASDVQLTRVATSSSGRFGTANVLRSLDHVVGRETTRAVTAGQVFDRTLLRRPILVRRSDVVTVYARTPGIRVRTSARAREDGSQGDLIMVESLADRRRYFARVTGPREVDVYAGGAQGSPSAPAHTQVSTGGSQNASGPVNR